VRRIYQVTAADVGATLRVSVTARSAGGSASALSDPTVPAVATDAPLASAPPVISGEAREGRTLKASPGSWRRPAPNAYAFQWLRCDADGASCAPVDSATSSAHALGSDDVGHTLRVQLGGSNAAGASSVLSGPSAVVAPAGEAPASTSPPRLSGAAVSGSRLALSNGGWSGAQARSFSYSWQRCDANGAACTAIAGAHDAGYVLGTGDVAHRVRATVTATNGDGSSVAYSAPTRVVTPLAPVNRVLPRIRGQLAVGSTLTAAAGVWTGAGPISYSLQWARFDAKAGPQPIPGADRASYTLAAADAGQRLLVQVTAQNSRGAVFSNSTLTGRVAGAPASAPHNTSRPTISGEARDGKTLQASHGGWQGTAPISYSYQWLRCNTSGGGCSALGYASSASYVLRTADVGHRLRVEVRASNGGGSATVLSDPTAVVAARGEAPASSSPPSLSGSAVVGSTLSLSNGSWRGTQPFSFKYWWQRCDVNGNNCATIGGATSHTYTLGKSDFGHRLRGAVQARNDAGESTAYSAASSVVTSLAPFNTKAPAISGSAVSGSTLKASTGSWSGSSPISYFYQWARFNSKGGYDPIAGAVHSSYTAVEADVGHKLLVQVKAQNSHGSAFANSAAVGPVQAGKSPPPPPSSSSGAVELSGHVISVPATSVSLPNRLIVSGVKYIPSVIRTRKPFIARFRVTDTQGHVVRGANVFVLGIPYGWVLPPGTHQTDMQGYVNVRMVPEANLPLRRGALVVYVRASKPGGRLIAGVSGSRLTQVLIR
jgi:hypothetical protein